jgi:hypothetical protein
VTTFWKGSDGTEMREARFSKCLFGSETCSDLILKECPAGHNFIGLRFLARHLVTFNFPKRMMYLRRTSAGPLTNQDNSAEPSVPAFAEAEKFLTALKAKGQLLGWPKDAHGHISVKVADAASLDTFPVSLTFDAKKPGDVSDYHYTVVQAAKDSPWKLIRAWRTNPAGNIAEEYSVP